MSRTTFSGPVKSGTIRYNQYENVGTTVLTQSTALAFNGGSAVSTTINIPVGCQLLDIVVDVLTAFNSGSSDTLSVGNIAAGTQYASGVNAQTAGRVRPTFTAAQLAAMLSTTNDVDSSVTGQSSNSLLVATVTSVGTANTAGSVVVTYTYKQPDDRSAFGNQ